ncbi:hypothetical protein [Chitinivibrio alkaliphilus]|uniref:Uncharacterized protein n=1 Tax=Chitinivibrio alkaliphilus ACht1 TaxID=1313304 RepID=U7D9H3_9BACT|nr:hypothetical protein [Chitinivibrio alkaliphilus]ERP31060.1 hypothetical protein CALK_2089 [Chitinivibrio alkaliphilus ACht1]
MEEVVVQSNGATAVVFFAALFFFHFFEDLFGLRGFFKVIAAAVVAYLYRVYWGLLWAQVLHAMVAFGLGDLIQ